MITRLDAANTAVLVIDYQEKLLPAMHESEACLAAGLKMIQAARVLGLPILATEQYPAGLGPTSQQIRQSLDGAVPIVEKLQFSSCVPRVNQWLSDQKRLNIIIVGIEAHVCVQQTVLDLLAGGYQPVLCADAVSSRHILDRDTAIERMRQAGTWISTTESVIFEILRQAGTDAFKKILKIVK